MTQRIHLGISTCPNDTFAMHGLLCGKIDTCGLRFNIELLDIEELNRALFAGRFDIAKTSFHASLRLTEETIVLPVGAALGFGVGPLLLAAKPNDVPSRPDQLTLCPGKYTTAALLFELFYSNTTRVEQRLFSEIMRALARREADFGVCIHEGRFTYRSHGLSCVEDLGARWETVTELPLPLGGLVGRQYLGTEILTLVTEVIRDSIRYSHEHRDEAILSMRRYAQEMDDEVLWKHVRLYVNDWTTDLGEVGARALQELSRRAREIGLVTHDARPLQILS